MATFDRFSALHEDIEKITFEQNEEDLELCFEGISLFLRAEEILQGIEFECSTPVEATRSLLWRYLVSVPSTAYVCLRCAIQGQYRIAYNLSRILIEETVSITYFSENIDRAFNVLNNSIKSGIPKEPKFSTKLKKLDSKSKKSLIELYNKLSEGTSHANALLFPDTLIDEQERKLIKPQEPTYDKESINWVILTVLRLLYISIRNLFETYRELSEDEAFIAKSIHFSKNAESRVLTSLE